MTNRGCGEDKGRTDWLETGMGCNGGVIISRDGEVYADYLNQLSQ